MSSFYSRCLVCGVDLPRGCRFCGERCRDAWHAKHDGEAVARVLTDEWPLVERESEAAERSTAVRAWGAVGDTRRGDGVTVIAPTARCATCHGRGTVRVELRGRIETRADCGDCNGTGART